MSKYLMILVSLALSGSIWAADSAEKKVEIQPAMHTAALSCVFGDSDLELSKALAVTIDPVKHKKWNLPATKIKVICWNDEQTVIVSAIVDPRDSISVFAYKATMAINGNKQDATVDFVDHYFPNVNRQRYVFFFRTNDKKIFLTLPFEYGKVQGNFGVFGQDPDSSTDTKTK